MQDGDLAGMVKNVKANTAMYPLAAAANPPEQKFVNISGMKFNTVHANDFNFYEELNEVVQHEPADFFDPDTVGLFASIGIKKGKPFAPDARMKAILTDAVAVGNATARAMTFAPRDPRQRFFTDRQWNTGFLGGYDVLGWRRTHAGWREPCSITTRPASRRRWRRPSPASGRPTSTPPAIPGANGSTAARTTR